MEIAFDQIDCKDQFYWMKTHDTSNDGDTHVTVASCIYAYSFDVRQPKVNN